MKNKLMTCCLVVCLLLALPLTAMAQQIDYSQKGSISVTLATKNPQEVIAGAELSIYYVATLGINTDGNMNYRYTEGFEECDILLDDPTLTEKLSAYVSSNAVLSQKTVTDAQGNVTFSNLRLGLYLIKQTGEVAGYAPCTSFLVTVPMETDSGYEYQVNASPKTDVARLTDLTVKKVWNTGSTSSIPDSVKVQLLRGAEVIKTAILNKQNNWQITYMNMPEADDYSIKEVNVPTGFTATYGQSGYEFTVTNTPALAQTGQVVWPIPVLALIGMTFMTAGIMILRKPGKYNA